MITTEYLSASVVMHLSDCRDILPSLPRVHALITDPPYGVRFVRKNNRKVPDGPSSLYMDDEESVRALIAETIPLALSKADRAAIFSGNRMLWDYPRADNVGAVFVPASNGVCKWGFGCSHTILYYGKDPFLSDRLGSRPDGFLDYDSSNPKVAHPCAKPVKWMRWLVNRVSREGETVLDPFCGSGTTGVACVQTGRAFVGIEVVPEYFDLACERITAAMSQADMFITQPKVKHAKLALV